MQYQQHNQSSHLNPIALIDHYIIVAFGNVNVDDYILENYKIKLKEYDLMSEIINDITQCLLWQQNNPKMIISIKLREKIKDFKMRNESILQKIK